MTRKRRTIPPRSSEAVQTATERFSRFIRDSKPQKNKPKEYWCNAPYTSSYEEGLNNNNVTSFLFYLDITYPVLFNQLIVYGENIKVETRLYKKVGTQQGQIQLFGFTEEANVAPQTTVRLEAVTNKTTGESRDSFTSPIFMDMAEKKLIPSNDYFLALEVNYENIAGGSYLAACYDRGSTIGAMPKVPISINFTEGLPDVITATFEDSTLIAGCPIVTLLGPGFRGLIRTRGL